MGSWQLQEAKAKLSEVIATAQTQGPQIITQRGVNTAVIIPFDEWERAQAKAPPQPARRTADPLTKDERAKSEAFLKLLQSGPDFELPDRHQIRMRKALRF
jgi:prevent-host-death family protein